MLVEPPVEQERVVSAVVANHVGLTRARLIPRRKIGGGNNGHQNDRTIGKPTGYQAVKQLENVEMGTYKRVRDDSKLRKETNPFPI